MQLSQTETSCLGRDGNRIEGGDRVLKRECVSYPRGGTLRSSFFDSTWASYRFRNCSERFVPMNCRTTVVPRKEISCIEKTQGGNGFFPTVASHEVKITCNLTDRLRNELKGLSDGVKDIQISIERSGDEFRKDEICITNLDSENRIFEFDFLPHNFGFIFSILSIV